MLAALARVEMPEPTRVTRRGPGSAGASSCDEGEEAKKPQNSLAQHQSGAKPLSSSSLPPSVVAKKQRHIANALEVCRWGSTPPAPASPDATRSFTGLQQHLMTQTWEAR